jgi:hypothetical protein
MFIQFKENKLTQKDYLRSTKSRTLSKFNIKTYDLGCEAVSFVFELSLCNIVVQEKAGITMI